MPERDDIVRFFPVCAAVRIYLCYLESEYPTADMWRHETVRLKSVAKPLI